MHNLSKFVHLSISILIFLTEKRKNICDCLLKLQGSQEDLQVAHEEQISKFTQEKEIRSVKSDLISLVLKS